MKEEVQVISASKGRLVLTGSIHGIKWKGEYERVPGTLGFLLVKDYRDEQEYGNSALPHGNACVLPKLLGRAVLVRDKRFLNNPEVMAHEKGHVLATKHRLSKANYDDNEKMADRLARRFF